MAITLFGPSSGAALACVVGVLVEGRFTIAVTGSYVPDIATLRKVAEAIDLKKLAALK